MSDRTLSRADAVLTELIELVETARAFPMSSSCVLPRERTLDLLDELRAVLPPELIEARRLVSQRNTMLGEAQQRAEAIVRTATEHSDGLLASARAEARALVASGEAERARLVSSASVFQAANAEAARIQSEAADHCELMRDQAEQHAARLTSDAHQFADQILSGLVANLHGLAATAENGRAALGLGPEG